MYTIILSYKGGLYFFQVLSETKEKALMQWIQTYNFENVVGLDNSVRESLQMALNEEYSAPIKLKGLVNVYCTSCTIKRNLFLINIVKTDR
ncbi:MAG: hypothetical protein ACSHXL_06295 [Bacteroidota bacterium]